ncbi:hypothetical protein JOD44_001059 [Salimicrobium jeotgali]|nr:hypothetical protein [Salimicrobium jeotgali]MBM7695943.1 hypothetical protein [Salimicrobium jeotgali]
MQKRAVRIPVQLLKVTKTSTKKSPAQNMGPMIEKQLTHGTNLP